MSVVSEVDEIRSAVDRRMAPDPRNANQPPALGGIWHTENENGYLSLDSAKLLLLRDAPPGGQQRGPWLHWGTLKLNRVFINFCISRWIEEIAPAKSLPLPKGLMQPAALQLNLAIEQINFTGINYPAIQDLRDDDNGRIADLIRTPLTEYLDRWVSYDRHIQTKFGRHAIPVIGKIHENWRRPRSQLVELHEHLSDYAASFSLQRIASSAVDFHPIGRESGRNVFRVVGEPEILITLPEEDREYPRYFPGIVRIGSREIEIDVEPLGSVRLVHPILDQPGKPIERVSVDMMTHPFSLRAQPQGKLPPDLDVHTADQAIQLMRIAWLKYRNDRLEKSSKRADVVII